jgi:hypothetical protein
VVSLQLFFVLGFDDTGVGTRGPALARQVLPVPSTFNPCLLWGQGLTFSLAQLGP